MANTITVSSSTTAAAFLAFIHAGVALFAVWTRQFLWSLVRPLAIVRWFALLMLIVTLVLVNASDFTASLSVRLRWCMRLIIVLPGILIIPCLSRTPWEIKERLEVAWAKPYLRSLLFDVVKGAGAVSCYYGSNGLGSFVKVFRDRSLMRASISFIFFLMAMDFLCDFEEVIEVCDNFVVACFGLMLGKDQNLVGKTRVILTCLGICILKTYLRSNLKLLRMRMENQQIEDEQIEDVQIEDQDEAALNGHEATAANPSTAAGSSPLSNAAPTWSADWIRQIMWSLVRPLALVRWFALLMLVSTFVLVNASEFIASRNVHQQWRTRIIIVLPGILIIPYFSRRHWKIKEKLEAAWVNASQKIWLEPFDTPFLRSFFSEGRWEEVCERAWLSYLNKPYLQSTFYDTVKGAGIMLCYWGSNELGSFVKVFSDRCLVYASLCFIFFLLAMDLLCDFEDVLEVTDNFVFAGYGLMLGEEQKIVETSQVLITCGVICILKSYLRSNLKLLRLKLEKLEIDNQHEAMSNSGDQDFGADDAERSITVL